MTECYMATCAGVATGTDKSLINLFLSPATPTVRPKLYEIVLGSVATPADVAVNFLVGRTTAVGTEGAGFTPNNLDSAGPASQCDAGVGVFTVEPTYTANKQLLVFSVNQRSIFRWVASPGKELVLPATQNNGLGLKSSSVSSGTPAYESTIFFTE